LGNTDNDAERGSRSRYLGLIQSIGQLGGLAGNYTVGYLNDRTHSLTASFLLIALVYLVAGQSDSQFEDPRPHERAIEVM
jgi:hypothetical protein